MSKANKQIAALLYQSKGSDLNNPVVRSYLGLKQGDPGTNIAGLFSPQAATANPQPKKESAEPSQVLQDALLKRMKFANDVGFATPGPGMLTGAALKPEVRQWGEEYGGGIVAVDLSGITPSEEKALRYMLDPKWLERHNGG
ncbi:MAG: hypothetical protein A2Y75_01610 [Candidatus Solincola sediminis]|uniref:Uncharacterized protein n=1 Tax=Candidatus Solincola sediminis TaxID=1797199 RepID=A0A1F2WNK5_9ACTN|nr:MAG: hypothetical protein A2Y75_01610 [Candidatus Solincola sediminis]